MKTEAESLAVLKRKVKDFPETLVILGSGWNAVLEGLSVEMEIGYETLFGVKATAPGHAGKLVVASMGNKRVAFMAGRFHMYEGYSGRQATLPIRVFGEVGVKQLVVTTAVGALNEKYRVGDLVVVSDLITIFLALDSPLSGPQFLDMSEVFSPRLRAIAREVLVDNSIPFHEGVHVFYRGPQFESPADKMALRFLGADVTGMSLAPETILARWLKLDVLGLALVTNLAFVKHSADDVLAEAEKVREQLKTVLVGIIEQV